MVEKNADFSRTKFERSSSVPLHGTKKRRNFEGIMAAFIAIEMLMKNAGLKAWALFVQPMRE
jgi:hypothetical protein